MVTGVNANRKGFFMRKNIFGTLLTYVGNKSKDNLVMESVLDILSSKKGKSRKATLFSTFMILFFYITFGAATLYLLINSGS